MDRPVLFFGQTSALFFFEGGGGADVTGGRPERPTLFSVDFWSLGLIDDGGQLKIRTLQ